jgi:hypothetical protein
MAPSQTSTPARPSWACKKPGRCARKNGSRLGLDTSPAAVAVHGHQHHRMAGPWTGIRRPGTVEEAGQWMDMRRSGTGEEAGPWTNMRRPGTRTVEEAGSLTDMPWYI